MNEITKQHFIFPQNMGKIKAPTHISKCQSGFCGDTIELFAIIDKDGRVSDIKYRVFGCYAIIAAASAISEWAKGKTLADVHNASLPLAKALLGNDIEHEKEHCVMVAVQAFQKLKEK